MEASIIFKMYLHQKYHHRNEYTESMHPMLIIPNPVILLIGQPWLWHEDEKYYIHDLQHNDQSKDL